MKRLISRVLRLLIMGALILGGCCILPPPPASAAPAVPEDGRPSLDFDGSDKLLAGCTTAFDGELKLTNTGETGDDALGYRLWYTLEDELISSVYISGTQMFAGEFFTITETLAAGTSVTIPYTVTMVSATAGWAGGATAHINFTAEPLNRISHQAHLRVSIENNCSTGVFTPDLAGVKVTCSEMKDPETGVSLGSFPAITWRFENFPIGVGIPSWLLSGSVMTNSFNLPPGGGAWHGFFDEEDLKWDQEKQVFFYEQSLWVLDQTTWPAFGYVGSEVRATLPNGGEVTQKYVTTVGAYANPCIQPFSLFLAFAGK